MCESVDKSECASVCVSVYLMDALEYFASLLSGRCGSSCAQSRTIIEIEFLFLMLCVRVSECARCARVASACASIS